MSIKKEKLRGAFLLVENTLYAANDGHPFDRDGVIALCIANISSKSDKVIDTHKDLDNRSWLPEFSKNQLKQYIDYPNLLTRDRKEEIRTTGDYSGRWLLELLQNMDDAMGPKDKSKFIGTKGLGFLSVIEISTSPAIFSGDFHFQFNKEKTIKQLAANGVPDDFASQAPRFQVPWPTTPDAHVKSLQNAGFNTVIKLDIREDSVDDVKAQLQEIDYHFLLFSQNIEELSIEFDDQRSTFSKNVGEPNGSAERSRAEVEIQIGRTGQKDRTERWLKWQRNWESAAETSKRSSCMFCLQIKNDVCVPHARHTKVYNFFPTEQSSEIKGFLHLSFNLTSDRKRLLMWGDKQDVSWKSKQCHSENKKLVNEVRSLIIEDVIEDPRVPVETTLKVFASLNKYSFIEIAKGEPLKRVQANIIGALKDHPFLPRFGGGLTDINSIKLWQYDFIECLEEYERISVQNLAPKELSTVFEELKKYDVEEIGSYRALMILVHSQLKNKTARSRSHIAKVVSHYSRSDANAASMFVNRIYFLTNADNEIVKLNNYIFVDDALSTPSFVDTPRLSKGSSKDLKNGFLKNGVPEALQNLIGQRFISDERAFFQSKFTEFLENADQSVWLESGYEILGFAFNCFQQSYEIFMEALEAEKLDLRLPALEGGWCPSYQMYFSISWMKNNYLKTWFDAHSKEMDFELVGIKGFKQRLFAELQKTQKKKKEPPDDRKLREFLKLIGVRALPGFSEAESWTPIVTRPNYHTLIRQHFRWLHDDFWIIGLIDFLNIQNFEDGIVAAEAILTASKKSPARYRRHGAPRYRFEHHPQFYNLACFQLYEGQWLELNASPINPSGRYAPKECFLSEVPSNVFPSISPSRIKKVLGTKADAFVNSVGLEESFEPDIDVWKSWITRLGDGYTTLLAKGHQSDRLNAQVQEFFSAFIERHDLSISYDGDTLVPTKSKEPDNSAYAFVPARSVVVNNTTIDERDLARALLGTDAAIFALEATEVNRQDLNQKLGLNNLTQRFELQVDATPVSFHCKQAYVDWLTARWDIFQALDKEFSEEQTTRLMEEFTSRAEVCDELQVHFKDKEKNDEVGQNYTSPRYFELFTSPLDEAAIYILDDENKRNLIEYLCIHFFGWFAVTELVTVLMQEPIDLDEIRKKLKQNNLPPHLIDNFKALNKTQEEELRKQELALEEDERLKRAETKNSATHKDDDIQNEDESDLSDLIEKEEVDEPSLSPIESTALPNKDNLQGNSSQRANTPQQAPAANQNKRKSRSGFGTRVSGHLRARNSNEVVGRPYFDDEDKSNPSNIKTGVAAEEIVSELIKSVLQPEFFDHIGGTNTGFDIQYRLGEQDYFVEVKGLLGSWNDSDVLLSKPQFEKAQKEGERFSIFVVEFVGDEKKRAIWEIRNPAEYFKKMQIDHGWREFALSHNEIAPKVGRYLLVDGRRLKIEKIISKGGLFTRLQVQGLEKTTTFNPKSMTIELGDDE